MIWKMNLMSAIEWIEIQVRVIINSLLYWITQPGKSIKDVIP
jgi:hypothetical protein